LSKTHFTPSLSQLNIPLKKNERGNVSLWQARFWEHRIRDNRDNRDLQTYVDYILYNPVKHGYVKNLLTGLIRLFIDLLRTGGLILLGEHKAGKPSCIMTSSNTGYVY
jgi:hypothetical protein